jgi:hypothetical protein
MQILTSSHLLWLMILWLIILVSLQAIQVLHHIHICSYVKYTMLRLDKITVQLRTYASFARSKKYINLQFLKAYKFLLCTLASKDEIHSKIKIIKLPNPKYSNSKYFALLD